MKAGTRAKADPCAEKTVSATVFFVCRNVLTVLASFTAEEIIAFVFVGIDKDANATFFPGKPWKPLYELKWACEKLRGDRRIFPGFPKTIRRHLTWMPTTLATHSMARFKRTHLCVKVMNMHAIRLT